MGFLDRLINKKPNIECAPITIDLNENGFAVNGVQFPFPARASELIKLLGEPRIAENQYMEKVAEIYCEKFGFDRESFSAYDYYWDDIGIFARTFEHETVHSLFIYFGKCKYPMPMPKCAFSGTLLINGRPWQERVLVEGGLRGAVPLGKNHIYVSRYGNIAKEKSVRVMELALDRNKLEFFDRY